MNAGISVEEIRSHLAKIRAGGRWPVRIRMHPLDIELLRRRYLPESDQFRVIANGGWMLGVTLEADDSVARGDPRIDYEE